MMLFLEIEKKKWIPRGKSPIIYKYRLYIYSSFHDLIRNRFLYVTKTLESLLYVNLISIAFIQ